ncbi:YceI family protein [Nonomuraea turkmeniaca]|uniref:YceI family protein n=1 Tax=Nonomuraea turkmeniaca TaxID=103838 RepID=A0A5S4FRY0_9ACTN|nr:YceI family protein [Nonomuraea turkmeniaca]TMR23418.1 YceI family protein [Nonomuraea turkmeniaca]
MTTTSMLSELTGDYVLDTAHTRIGFVARHRMATKVRGHFEEFEGSAHLDGDDPSKSSAELTIQAESIQTRNPRRDDPLRSEFLDMRNHPTITFTSIGVKQVDETSFKVTGDLTIRGVTKPVTVDFKLTGAENGPRGSFRVCFTGSVTISRKDWGVNWNAATQVLVSEKVALEFDIAAIRRP